LASHLENLLVHLLKWRYQPMGRQIGHSWADSIREARTQTAAGLSAAYTDSQQFHDSMARCYRSARRQAGCQTDLPQPTFPVSCPWSVDQILNEGFWPDT
jgi:hypothetical protein